MRLSKERLAFAAGLGLALLFLWQAMKLDPWSIIGPGPGLFPQAITIFCAAVAGLLVLVPALSRGLGGPMGASVAGEAAEEEEEAEEPPGPAERRIFWLYALALPFLGIAATYLGFLLLSLVLVMGLSWYTEGRSWRGALLFAVLAGLVGLIGFGEVLGASVPEIELDRIILRLFR